LAREGGATKLFVTFFPALLIVPVAIALRQAYALHVVALALSLQLNAWLSFFMSGGGSFVGQSGPTALELHLVALSAAAVVAARYRVLQERGAWRWVGRMTYPTRLILITMLLSFVHSSERRISLFSVLQLGQFYLVYLAALNTVRSRRELELVVYALLATAVMQAGVYFVENATGVTFTLTGELVEKGGALARHGGTISTHPSGFAEFMNPLFAIACAMF